MHHTYSDLDNIEFTQGLIFTQIEIIYITTPFILYELHPSQNLSESHSLQEKN